MFVSYFIVCLCITYISLLYKDVQCFSSSKVTITAFYFLRLKSEEIQISVICCAPEVVTGRGLTLKCLHRASYTVREQRVGLVAFCDCVREPGK